MDTFFQDLKFGARLLWKDRGFSLTAILTLALCIGANTAIFTIVNSVLLRPLPVADADRLVLMYASYLNAGFEYADSAIPDYFDRIRDVSAISDSALYRTPGMTIGEEGNPERVTAMITTPSLFPLLRVEPMLGRAFLEEEGEQGNERKVILTYDVWQRLYGGRPDVIGLDLRVNGNPYQIVGVMLAGFVFADPEVKIWMPAAFTSEEKSDEGRHNNNWTNVARLKPGATSAQVLAQLQAIDAANFERFPETRQILINAGYRSGTTPFQAHMVRNVKDALYLLWGGVFVVLLIGCVNIANLTLVRTSVRLRELTTRMALGAGQARVTRQLITEAVMLTLIAGATGLLLGRAGLVLLGRLNIQEIPRGTEISMDPTVWWFTLALSVLVGIVVGVIPLANVFRVNLNAVVREEGRSGTASRGARLIRDTLVTAQVALALVLLVGAGLLLASFRRVLSVDPGFQAAQALSASVSLPTSRYADDDSLRAYTARLMERVRSIPGVRAAGFSDSLPFTGSTSSSVIFAEGYEMKPGESIVSPSRNSVSDGYFEAMRIGLVSGRLFDQRDRADSQKAIIVDEQLAHHFWGDVDPVGRVMWRPLSVEGITAPTEKNTEKFTVIGVVRNVKQRDLVETKDTPVGAYYFPFTQDTSRNIALALRIEGSPEAVVSTLRREVTQLDPDMPVYGVMSMTERIDRSLVSRRTPLLLAIGFGAVALLLSAIGIYGVLAYLVTQRTREIGIRLALGSTIGAIVALVVREGLRVVGIGLVLGLVGLLALARVIESQLYGVRPLEPSVLIIVTLLLAVVGLVACLLPARRATRVNPVVALTGE